MLRWIGAWIVGTIGFSLVVACKTKSVATTRLSRKDQAISHPLAATDSSREQAAPTASSPSGVEPQVGLRIVEIRAGGDHTWALRSDGKLFGWGTNSYGALGPDKTAKVWRQPRQMEGIPQVKHVATGRWHTCAIVDTGNVLCWGRNFGGTLGNGTGKDELFVPPGRVIDVSDAVEISAASDFGTGGTSCARVSNNRVYCWGILARTPLGMPRRFDALGLATQVAAEIWTACAVQFDRSLKCSGMIVGSPFATKRYYPDGKLPHLPETVKIVVGSCHACLISAAERVHCWGGMEYEKLEQRDKPDKEILQLLPPPGPVPQLENIVDIAIGSHDETCAVRRDGVLLCWERADPEGKGGHPSKPHPIPELSGVIQVTLGANHSCALTGVGQVFCWGDNQQAQLGTGNIQPAKGPLAVHID